MPGFILTLFSVGLCLAVTSIVLWVLLDIKDFPWLAALRQIRFSLFTLMGLVSALSIALGMQRLQDEYPAAFYMPFPATLFVCVAGFGLLAALLGEFSSRTRRGGSGTALESFRERQQQQTMAPPLIKSAQPDSDATPRRQKERWRWWLRPMPNRFRSIGHRASQITKPQGYYIRDE